MSGETENVAAPGTDYLGEHRGLSVMPGPFASAEAAGKQLW